MMAAATTDWTLERIERLRALWAAGDTTAAIGGQMGISKNAVVGKVHRLNLPARPSPITRGAPRAPKAPRQGRKPSLPPLMLPEHPKADFPPRLDAPAVVAIPPVRTEVLTRPRMRSGCCWPLGEPGKAGFRFCGDAVTTLKCPYCEEHRKLAYVSKAPRHRDSEEIADACA